MNDIGWIRKIIIVIRININVILIKELNIILVN